jgi:flavorubredoxin
MTAVVVYESMFGNTRAVAEAVARGLRRHVDTEVYEVNAVPPLPPMTDLLVVGGPTHAFSMSRASTRTDAHKQSRDGHVVSEGMGVREWIDTLPRRVTATEVAVFDTKVKRPMTGSAAKSAAKALSSRGYHLTAKPESFGVEGTPGPLGPGELERAEEWGSGLADALHLTAH